MTQNNDATSKPNSVSNEIPSLAIDISPNLVAEGYLNSINGDSAIDARSRLAEFLTENRVIASVNYDPTIDEKDSVLFRLACTTELSVLIADEGGELSNWISVAELEQKFLDAFPGFEVDIHPELTHFDEDSLEDDTFAEEGAEPEFDEYPADAFASDLEVELDPAFSPEEDGDFPEEPDTRVFLFSKRGLGNGLLVSVLAGSEVTAASARGWSAFRFVDNSYLATPEATTAEMPSIRVKITGEDANAWTFLEVETPSNNAKNGNEHVLFLTEAAHQRPVLNKEGLSDEAQLLISAIANEQLRADSELNALLADPAFSGTADAVIAHAATAADFNGGSEDRAIAFLAALGLPIDFVSAVIRGEELENTRVYGEGSLVSDLFDLAVDGIGSLRAIGAEPGFLEKVDNVMKENPLLAYGLSAAEGGIALTLLAAGGKATGFKKFALVSGGVALLADAVTDIFVTRKRQQLRKES